MRSLTLFIRKIFFFILPAYSKLLAWADENPPHPVLAMNIFGFIAILARVFALARHPTVPQPSPIADALLYSMMTAYLLLAIFIAYRAAIRTGAKTLAAAALTIIGFPLFWGSLYTTMSNYGVCLLYGNTPVSDVGSSIYFSYILFTSAGLGDIHPIGLCRAIAAIEAVLGYLSLGTLVATLMALLSS